jgi:iron complex outermembrane receptor protein
MIGRLKRGFANPLYRPKNKKDKRVTCSIYRVPYLSVIVSSIVLLSVPVGAKELKQSYQLCVKAEMLGAALDEIYSQTGIQIIYPYDLVESVSINRLCGMYSIDDALAVMLKDTGFSGGLTKREVIVISQSNGLVERTSAKPSEKSKQVNQSLLTRMSALIFGAVAPSSAIAQDGGPEGQSQYALEEIIVTATKRSTSILDVPFSINAQSQKDIQRAGATSLEELSRNVAGLSIQNLGPGQSQVSIRGVSAGQIVRDQPGVKEQVGVYLDESVISLSLFTPDLDLYDLSRVETLRGPQGTLFGSGSVGGTIRYITNQPNPSESNGSIEVNLNTISDGESGGHIKGMINTPFDSGNSAFRAVAYHTEYGGFIDASGPAGGDDVNSGSRTGGRLVLTFQPTDSLSVTPRFIVQNIETDGNNRSEVFNFLASAAGETLGEHEQYLLRREGFEDNTTIADLAIEAGFNGFDLTSITSYTDREIVVSRDASALTHSVSEDLGYSPSVNATPSNLLDTTDVSQLTQELRLTSNGDSNFEWLFGLFYSDTERNYAQRLPTPGYDAFTDLALGAGTSNAVANGFPGDSPFNSDLPYDLEQISLYGEINYSLTEKLDLTVGARYYDYDETRIITSGGLFANGDTDIVDQTSSDGFNSRILLNYEANDNVSWNAQISEGFRLGGVNDPLNANLCQAGDRDIFGGFQNYGDESLINYEIGVKAQYDTLQFNAAVFYADIKDLQVTIDAGTCSSRISFNVPKAHASGIEVELKSKPSQHWDFSLTASLLEAEFDSTVLDANGNTLGGIQDGNRLASVPELSAATTATYSRHGQLLGADGEMYFSSTFQHVGDRITQPGDQVVGAGVFAHGLAFGNLTGAEVTSLELELPSYEIVNLNIGFESESWELAFYVNNVFDEDALLSFDRERGGRARLAYRTNQPRTVGLTYRKFY